MAFDGVKIAREAFREGVDKNNDKKIDQSERALFDPESIAKGIQNRVDGIKKQIAEVAHGDKEAIKALENKVLPQLERNITVKVQVLKNLNGKTDEQRKEAARGAAREIYRVLNFIMTTQIPNLTVETKSVKDATGKTKKETVLVNKKAKKIENDIKIEQSFNEKSIQDMVKTVNTTSEKVTDGNHLNADMTKHSAQILGMVELYSSIYAKTLHELNPDMEATQVDKLFKASKSTLLSSLGWNGTQFEVREKQTLKKYLKNIGASDGVLQAVKGFLDLQTHQMNLGKKIGESWDTDKQANLFRKNINEQLGDFGGDVSKLNRNFSFTSFIPTYERHQIVKQEKLVQWESSMKANIAKTVSEYNIARTLGFSDPVVDNIEALEGGIGYAMVEDFMGSVKFFADPLEAIYQLSAIIPALPKIAEEIGTTLKGAVTGDQYKLGRVLGHLIFLRSLKLVKDASPMLTAYAKSKVPQSVITKVNKVATSTKSTLLKIPGAKLAVKGAVGASNALGKAKKLTTAGLSKLPGAKVVAGAVNSTSNIIKKGNNFLNKPRSINILRSNKISKASPAAALPTSTVIPFSQNGIALSTPNTVSNSMPSSNVFSNKNILPNTNSTHLNIKGTPNAHGNSILPSSLSQKGQYIQQEILGSSNILRKDTIIKHLQEDPESLLEAISPLENTHNGFKVLGLSHQTELDELIEVTKKALHAKNNNLNVVQIRPGNGHIEHMKILSDLKEAKGWNPALIDGYLERNPRELAIAIQNMISDFERMKLLGLKDAGEFVKFQKKLQEKLIELKIKEDPVKFLETINKLSDEDKLSNLGLSTQEELANLVSKTQHTIEQNKLPISEPVVVDVVTSVEGVASEWATKFHELIKGKAYIDISDFRNYFSDLNTSLGSLATTEKGTKLLTHFDDLAKNLEPHMQRELVFRLLENDMNLAKKLLFPNNAQNKIVAFGFSQKEYPSLVLKFAESGDQKFLHLFGDGSLKDINLEKQYMEKLLAYYQKYNKGPGTGDFSKNFLEDRLKEINVPKTTQNNSYAATEY